MGQRLARLAKRTLDVTASAIGIAVTAPPMLAVAGAIAFTMGRPVLFRQPRPGKGGRVFTLYKFRTMRPPSQDEVATRTDALRTTAIGHFLRRTSLDELPSLINVLRGEMSLVGPRPLLVEYLERYTPEQARRHDVSPGVTGWAQVNGREGIPFSRRLALDVWYVDHWSFLLDLRILVRTLGVALGGKGHFGGGADIEAVDDLGFNRPRGQAGPAAGAVHAPEDETA